MRILPLALFGIGLVISNAHARPVSYPGGWTLDTMNYAERSSLHVHYSPTAETSIGYRFEDWRGRDFTSHSIHVNNLLKRWNTEDSQANIYVQSGAGIANSHASDSQEAIGYTGIATDWETRRYFVSYQNRYTEAKDIVGFFRQSARVGWAPYEGDYGDLHTWIMLDVRHDPEAPDSVTVTPLVRLLKSTHLIETGITDRGDLTFNYIYRF